MHVGGGRGKEPSVVTLKTLEGLECDSSDSNRRKGMENLCSSRRDAPSHGAANARENRTSYVENPIHKYVG